MPRQSPTGGESVRPRGAAGLLRPSRVLRIVLALISLAAGGELRAQESPFTVPDTIVIQEAMGGAFARRFDLIPSRDLVVVRITPGVLTEQASPTLWIDEDRVQVTPGESVNLRARRRQSFRISVQSVPGTGTYQGAIEIVYAQEDSAGGRQDTLSMEVPVRVVVDSIRSPAGISPQAIELVGIVGAASSQQRFTLEAARDLRDLTFVRGALRRSGGADTIPGSFVEITPVVTTLRRGERQEFVVTVNSVPAPGTYGGWIEVSYAGKAEGAREGIQLSLSAARLTTIPARGVLEFANAAWGMGRTREDGIAIGLDAGDERVSSTLLGRLAREIQFGVTPLVRTGKEWETIVLRPVRDTTFRADEDAQYLLKFPNPGAEPGVYTGKLTLKSSQVGTIATVPLEVRVRGAEWLAWLLLLVGLGTSWWVTHWNTVGRRKNSLRGELMAVEARLERANVTARRRRELTAELDAVRRHLEQGRLEQAEQVVRGASAGIEEASAKKTALQEKAAEVHKVRAGFRSVADRVREEAGAQASVLRYVERIDQRLGAIASDIEGERYEDAADERLRASVEAGSGAARDLDSLLGDLKEIRDAIDRLNRDFRQAYPDRADITAALSREYLEDARFELASIDGPADVAAVKQRFTSIRETLSGGLDVIGRLRAFEMEIQRREREPGRSLGRSRAALTELLACLEGGTVPAQAELDALRRVIDSEAAPTQEKGGKEEAAPEGGAGSFAKAEAPSVGAPASFPPGPAPVSSPSPLPSHRGEEGVRRWWRDVRRWWTPQRTDLAMKVFLNLLALAILVPIGFDQTYGKSATFGSNDLVMEYFALFLWGFGIQAATATVGGVLTTIRGDRRPDAPQA
ncbi:MAG TPA: hypothetical protein VHG28_04265 [Longimicrobiaceae bacterium]|nr:hypothetical protein [Longimicrobiaceae bacterium]